MNSSFEVSSRGSFALVSYVPPSLKSSVCQLRQSLPGGELPEPHITVLPPRPLHLPLDMLDNQIAYVLQQFSAFEVGLSEVQCFPETNFLYLDIAEGANRLHALHRALNAGVLAHAEAFEFRPHVTLSGPIPSERLEHERVSANGAWSRMAGRRYLTISEIVCLWKAPGDEDLGWTRVQSYVLNDKKLVAGAAATNRTY